MFPDILLSIVFHTIFYCIGLNAVNYIFLGKFINIIINTRIICALIIIMIIGFISRLWHSKEIYKTYNDLDKTKKHMDQAYITWYFLS
jgi:large-conductance mechanosensitive channel